jgi:hypothetical protein
MELIRLTQNTPGVKADLTLCRTRDIDIAFVFEEVKMRKIVCLTALLVLAMGSRPSPAQDFSEYHNQAELTAMLQSMVNSHRNLAGLQSIGKTLEGRDIWLIEIANPAGVPVKERPGLFIAANFEGDHLIGSEAALFIADYLLKNYPGDAEVKQRLDNHVVYILPRVNPDAAEVMFGAVKSGRKTNAAPRDDDSDGRLDEDGPEDLNKDGFIALLRVKSSEGEYMVDPEEPRLMKRADPKKGEAGGYKLYWEGIDNDRDGFINEDPPGGTDINRNFMHEYPYFKSDAGPHMVSEPESRAVMNWIVAHRNVAAILTFGENDNLIVPPTSSGRLGPARELDLVRFADAGLAEAGRVGMIQTGFFAGRGRFGGMFEMGEMFFMMTGGERRRESAQTQTAASGRPRMPDRKPATTVSAADNDYFKAASDKYRELTGFKQALYVREPQGAFFQYGYYQFGVPSFSTPGWGSTTAEAAGPRRPGMTPSGSSAGESGPPAAATTGRSQTTQFDAQTMRGAEFIQMMRGGGAQAQRAQAGQALPPGIDKQVLKFFDAEKIDGFLNWTKFTHPDLGEVEIGGFKPYSVTNPPAAKIAEIGATHAKYAVYLMSLFPKVKIARTEITNHGGGLFRVRAEVENSGFWPTALAQGVTARAVKPTMVQLGVKPEDIISGHGKTNFFQALNGSGGRQKFEWLIKGRAGEKIELKVVSEKAGADTATIVLK